MKKQYAEMLNKKRLNVPGLTWFGHKNVFIATEPQPWHIHRGCIEFILVVKGSENYFIDGQHYPVRAGQIFVAFEEQAHRSFYPYQTCSETYWFRFDLSEAPFLLLAPPADEQYRRAIRGIGRHVLDADKAESRYICQAYQAFAQGDREYGLSLVLAFLSHLLLTDTGHRELPRDWEVTAFVDAHLTEELTPEAVAQRFHMSPSALKTAFLNHTGYSLHKYVNACRVEKAKKLLRQGRSVTETAMELGFSSSDYFSTVFRRYLHMSPTEYLHGGPPGEERREVVVYEDNGS